MNSENTIELTGNEFVDAYNLGFEAGKTLVEQEEQRIDDRRWDEYRRANAAEKERDELKEEIIKLKICETCADRFMSGALGALAVELFGKDPRWAPRRTSCASS